MIRRLFIAYVAFISTFLAFVFVFLLPLRVISLVNNWWQNSFLPKQILYKTMKTITFLIIVFFLCNNIFANPTELEAKRLTNPCNEFPIVFYRDSLQINHNYRASLDYWLSDNDEHKAECLYQAAVNYAILNIYDSSFIYLEKYVGLNTDNRLIFADRAFLPLHKDEKWKSLKNKIETQFLDFASKGITNFNSELALEIYYLCILSNTLVYYGDILLLPDNCYKIFQLPHNDPGLRSFFRSITFDYITNGRFLELGNMVDSIFINIIMESGYPTIQDIGVCGGTLTYSIFKNMMYSNNNNLENIETQFKEGVIDPLSYGLLMDNYFIKIGKDQKFGTLLERRSPKYKINPKKIKKMNKARLEIGLEPLVFEEVVYKHKSAFNNKNFNL